MKKWFFAILPLVFLLVFSGCNINQSRIPEETAQEDTDSEDEEFRDDKDEDDEDKDDDDESEVEDDEDVLKSVSYRLNNSERPEIVEVIFSGFCEGRLERRVDMENLYGIDVLYSSVEGLVGSPIEVTFDHVDDPTLCFVYDPDELRGMPETNFLALYRSGSSSFAPFDPIDDIIIDSDEHTVTIPAKRDGVYVLVDVYQWFTAWGVDASEYAYEIDGLDYTSDWERSFDTGSIMELADKQWAQDNAPYFAVTNAEELASVVYYVNAFSDGATEYTVSIEADIDLTGYDWKPMGWSKMGNNHCFSGVVEGNGHTINGMTIEVTDQEAGFIGYGLFVRMSNLSFTNAYVSSSRSAGIAGGEVYGTAAWTGIHVQGEVESSKDECGAIIALSSGESFIDCSAEVRCDNSRYNYFTYEEMLQSTKKVIETFTLTLNDDYSISRDDFEGFDSLQWHVELDGVQILERGADDPHTGAPELTLASDLQWFKGKEGVHTIYLQAYQNGAYVRVSNIITYEL